MIRKRISGYLKSIFELRQTRLRVNALLEASPISSKSDRGTSIRSNEANASFVPAIRVIKVDNFHINRRNFSSLLSVLDHKRIQVKTGISQNSEVFPLIKAHGSYEAYLNFLPAAFIGEMNKEDLRKFRYKNVNVVECAIDEALSAAITRDHWQDSPLSKDLDLLFDRLWENDRDILQNCCAAVVFWTDYWSSFPDFHRFHAAVVFSGSYIYGRVLLTLAHFTQMRCFVIESFTTGHDYFFEERYLPIANNSNINLPGVQRYLASRSSDLDHRNRGKIRAFNKMRQMNNKNVRQPEAMPLPRTLTGYRVSVILGQVVNDFSVISGKGTILNTVPAYKSLIGTLLENPENYVIFKAHPWELKKQNVLRPFTEDAIRAWASKLPESMRTRLLVLSDWNLGQLLRVSDYVFTLYSQSALEAAMEGLKPIIIGGAFYDNGGFTSNFDDPAEAAHAVNNNRIAGTLTIDEYSKFETYLCTLIQDHLVNSDKSGINKICNRLTPYYPQKHLSSHQSELSVRGSWK